MGVLVGFFSGLVFALSLWPAIAKYAFGWRLSSVLLIQSTLIGSVVGALLGAITGPFYDGPMITSKTKIRHATLNGTAFFLAIYFGIAVIVWPISLFPPSMWDIVGIVITIVGFAWYGAVYGTIWHVVRQSRRKTAS